MGRLGPAISLPGSEARSAEQVEPRPERRSRSIVRPQEVNALATLDRSTSRFGWLLFSCPSADFEFHLAGLFVSVDDDVITVQDLAIQDF
jgi:hypothetical protein